MADFVEVIRRTVDGLSENTPEMRDRVYEKARSAVRRQLENMFPRPSDDMINRQLAKLESAIVNVESEHPSQEEPGSAPEVADQPYLPRQQPGLSFGINSNGLIAVAAPVPASEEDLRELGGLRGVLIEAVDDLISLTTGSNAYRQIEKIAGRYRLALFNENGDLLVDQLYAHGIRLENAASQIRKDVEGNDFPDFAMPVAEALDSVIALHGPTILSTALGRELVAKARTYESDVNLEERYRETALSLWRETRMRKPLVDPDDMEEVIQINANINEGKRPSHSNQLAHTTNNNLLVTLAKVAITIPAAALTSKAIEDSMIGAETAQRMSGLIDNCWKFFTTNKDLLAALASTAGSELVWIDSFLRWVDTRRKRRAD